jgi:citrate lyase subunit beta/citryl-CoA lyase
VIALNGKMIDKPVVARAERVLALARAAGVLGDVGDLEVKDE